MKKLVVRVLIGLVILLILAVVAVGFFLDGAVKKGVETVGRMLTKVDIKLDSVNLSILSGSVGKATKGVTDLFKKKKE